jgi:hypothetical protein
VALDRLAHLFEIVDALRCDLDAASLAAPPNENDATLGQREAGVLSF